MQRRLSLALSLSAPLRWVVCCSEAFFCLRSPPQRPRLLFSPHLPTQSLLALAPTHALVNPSLPPRVVPLNSGCGTPALRRGDPIRSALPPTYILWAGPSPSERVREESLCFPFPPPLQSRSDQQRRGRRPRPGSSECVLLKHSIPRQKGFPALTPRPSALPRPPSALGLPRSRQEFFQGFLEYHLRLSQARRESADGIQC